MTDITHFLPAGSDARLARISRDLTTSDLNRTMTLLVEAPDSEQAVAAGRALTEALGGIEGFSWVRGGPAGGLQEAFYDAYYPRRLSLLGHGPAEVAALFEEAPLRERIASLKERLASPTGTFLRRLAPEDPWMGFVTHLERLQAAQQGTLVVREGQFIVEDEAGTAAVVLAATQASPFDAEATAALLDEVEGAFAALSQPGWNLRIAGVHPIARRTEATIRADIQRVSAVGTVGVVLLLLLLFRSPRALFLGGLPLVGGMAMAAGACQVAFGSIHGLTLAFGATLIGVAIDYVAHLLNHHYLAPEEGGAEGTARLIWPGLALGCATTVAGLAGLAWTSFPGIREMAVFTSVGVASALVLTRWVLPPFLPEKPEAGSLHRSMEAAVAASLQGLQRRRRLLWVLPAVGVLLMAVGIPGLRWNDDLRALSALDPELLAQDEAIRERVARMDAGRMVVAFGATLEEALQRNDLVADRLRLAQERGEVGSVRSLAPLLPSVARQQDNRRAIPEDAWSRTTAALQSEGFVAAPFAPGQAVLEEAVEPLRWASFEGTPIEELVRPFRIESEGEVAILSFLRDADPQALSARFEGIEGVAFFDQNALLSEAYGGFRSRTLELVIAGLFAVFALVFVRYRDLRRALAAFAPAVIAAGATMGIVAMTQEQANLLHLVTLLLVLSMGVDYGVFMVESELHGDGAITLTSIVVACLSTMLSFGVLAMSESPAMQAMGSTAAIGVGLSLLLAPTAWLLMKKKKPSEG